MSRLGKALIQAAKEARAIARGEMDPSEYRVHLPHEIDVARARNELGLSQEEFAERLGLSVDAVRGWERGRSET